MYCWNSSNSITPELLLSITLKKGYTNLRSTEICSLAIRLVTSSIVSPLLCDVLKSLNTFLKRLGSRRQSSKMRERTSLSKWETVC